ncbi:hypothetical protein ACA910_003826 [Epithemia clementina (nom. ined.)]
MPSPPLPRAAYGPPRWMTVSIALAGCSWYIGVVLVILHDPSYQQHADASLGYIPSNWKIPKGSIHAYSPSLSSTEAGVAETELSARGIGPSHITTSALSESTKKKTTQTIAIFYHTYANPNKEAPSKNNVNVGGAKSVLTKEETMSIVAEQMNEIGQASNAAAADYHWELRYASVGEEGVINHTWIDRFCQEYENLSCEHLGHEREGHEEVTLQHLHDYCIDHPNHLVAYVHTKGTFHAHKDNDKWRQFLTKAALKDSCFRALDDDDTGKQQQCNVCGLQFYPIWITMFPGNFFAARCDYVKRLLPVTKHASKMSQIIDSVNAGRKEPNKKNSKNNNNYTKIWNTRVYRWQNDVLGSGRWSREAWIGSHPSLKPCDMAGNITQLFLAVPSDVGMEQIRQGIVQPAPRVPPTKGDWYRRNLKRLEQVIAEHAHEAHDARGDNNPNDHGCCARPHEYFLLPGQLYRYYKLYQQFPSSDSWVWQWYPEGMQWRDKINRVLGKATGNQSLDDSLLW